MQREITCINCPQGCRMTVTLEGKNVISVTGNTCKRGDTYARQECTAPTRIVTASLRVENRALPLSVKTRSPIPKEEIFPCMAALNALTLSAPIRMGDVVLPDVCGTGVDVIATRTVE